MKKYIAILCLIITACTLAPKEEKFINPIFYNKLIGKWRNEKIQLTPTQYYIQNNQGYSTTAKCNLLENSNISITLKCTFLPADPKNKKELIIIPSNEKPAFWIMKFTILPYTDEHSITIEEKSYYKGEPEFLSHTLYTVDTQIKNINSPLLP